MFSSCVPLTAHLYCTHLHTAALKVVGCSAYRPDGSILFVRLQQALTDNNPHLGLS